MQIFKESKNREQLILLTEKPEIIKYRPGAPSVTTMISGKKAQLGCMGCLNPRCMYFTENEVTCTEVSDFPNDKTLNTCPVDALNWDTSKNQPSINTEKCINCGICISRCPVGALYFDNEIKLNPKLDDCQQIVAVTEENEHKQAHQLDEAIKVAKIGKYIKESDLLFENIYEKLTQLTHHYHNPVGRNLLIALGCNCSMRRIGDVYTRMDAIYSLPEDNIIGAIEIEFGKDTLEASRAILDDVAVMNTRYGIDKLLNSPLAVCLQLPNARQGYWQVVKDINIVENIKINTITIGALMLLVWNGSFFTTKENDFYLDYDNMNLREIISKFIGENISITNKFLGILEPEK